LEETLEPLLKMNWAQGSEINQVLFLYSHSLHEYEILDIDCTNCCNHYNACCICYVLTKVGRERKHLNTRLGIYSMIIDTVNRI
jgi:hypothetical protein